MVDTRVSTLECMFFFFFNDTATTEIYTLSLHDALPIFVFQEFDQLFPWRTVRDNLVYPQRVNGRSKAEASVRADEYLRLMQDRKSTRLNSSHANISYAVFCLKKKKQTHNIAIYFPTVYH